MSLFFVLGNSPSLFYPNIYCLGTCLLTIRVLLIVPRLLHHGHRLLHFHTLGRRPLVSPLVDTLARRPGSRPALRRQQVHARLLDDQGQDAHAGPVQRGPLAEHGSNWFPGRPLGGLGHHGGFEIDHAMKTTTEASFNFWCGGGGGVVVSGPAQGEDKRTGRQVKHM